MSAIFHLPSDCIVINYHGEIRMSRPLRIV
nr:MAG TPA: hypothetical protein [Caudoviricetes sp.]